MIAGRFAPLVASLAAASALLAGCGGSSDRPSVLASHRPRPSDAGVVSRSPSPSPSPSTEAQRVEQAVRDYYAAVNRAIETGDLDGLRAKSTPNCPCRKLVATIERTRAEGRIEGALFTLRAVSATVASNNLATAETVVDALAGRVVDPNGKVVDTVRPLLNARNHVILVADGKTWLLDQVVPVN